MNNVVSSIISEEVKLIQLAEKLEEEKGRLKERKIIILLTVKSIILYEENFKFCQFSIEFDNLNRLIFDPNSLRNVIFEYTEGGFTQTLLLIIRNKTNFINLLKNYFNQYFLFNKGIFKELAISEDSTLFSSLEINFVPIMEILRVNFDDSHSIVNFQDEYFFFIPKSFDSSRLKDNKFEVLYFEDKAMSTQEDIKILVEFYEPSMSYWIAEDPDKKNVSIKAEIEFNSFMEKNYPNMDYRFSKQTLFRKKFNYMSDKALWKSWVIKCESVDFSLTFIFLRRMFFPPFFNTIHEFSVALVIRKSTDILYRDKFTNACENIASSLSPLDVLSQKEISAYIETNIESMTIIPEAQFFLETSAAYKGGFFYKISLNFCYKLFTIFEAYVKDIVKNYKERISEYIFELYCNERNFNLENYLMLVEEKDLKSTLRDALSALNPNLRNNKIAAKTWDKKVYRYFAHSLIKGLNAGLFSIDTIVELYTKCGKVIPELQELMRNFLYFEPSFFEDKIDNAAVNIQNTQLLNIIVNSKKKLIKLEYNHEIMISFIQTGFLFKLYSSDDIIGKLISILLEKNQSAELIG